MKIKTAILVLTAVAAVLALSLHAPIPQDEAYHLFADARRLAGIPNACDVLSNLPFLLSGLYGLSRKPRAPAAAYGILCLGVLLVGLGSAYYHYAPSTPALFWDRLPMTVAFMAFFSMLLEERVTRIPTLPPLLVIGAASALYWRWSGDLRPYLLVQFLPLLLMPLILALYPRRGLSTGPLLAAFGLYVAAKLLEHFDHQVFQRFFLSGHTLKHLAAAAAAACLIKAVPVKEETCCSASEPSSTP